MCCRYFALSIIIIIVIIIFISITHGKRAKFIGRIFKSRVTMNNSDMEMAERVGAVLNDTNRSLAERFRALFTLRGMATPEAIDNICKGFSDESALLKHELAYCLGQIRDSRSLPTLVRVLEDKTEAVMVRHEAGEALGAIGDTSVCDVLSKYVNDTASEVSETCQLALARLNWLRDKDGGYFRDNNPYMSVDPAPPSCDGDIDKWERDLTDKSKPLFLRYRALFSLRNQGGDNAVQAIVNAFHDPSALFKHELAYVLGQMKNPTAIPGLVERLKDVKENPMVRHECAEALGSIANEECLETLREFCKDREQVVRESCEIALDMYEFEKGDDFQYANTISEITKK